MQLLFDLDGTLTDPRAGIIASIRHALDSLGRPSPDEAELLAWIGPPLADSFSRLLGPGAEAGAALDAYRAYYAAEGIFQAELIAGVRETLEGLSEEAEALCVVTSKPSVYAERVVAHFELTPFFDAVYGPGLDGALNDKRALIAHVLRAEALEGGQAVMIGDRHFDITGARHNGLRSIGVLWGFGSRDELAEADALCGDPAELASIVAGLA